MNSNHPFQPVTMIPLRRCGSHAIRLRLNFNPNFYSPYPLHIVDFMPLLPLYGDLNQDANYFQLILDLAGLQALSLVKWDKVAIDPVQLFEKLKNKERSIHAVAWELLFEGAKIHDGRVVLDKSLDNVHYWKELLALFPNMLFLNLVRDPRAQVNSMNRAIIHEFDTILNAQIWLKAHQTTEELIKKHPEKVLTIRYEDFIEDEAEATRKICKFLGLKFLPEMLDISKSPEAKRISNQSALWESNSSPPIKKNVDKYKESLTKEEIEQIETVTSYYMDFYGYSKTTSAKAIITEATWEAARQRSAERRQAAWDKLKASKPQDYLIRKRRADYIEMCRKNLLQKSKS